jgi:hypothetical protein
LNNAGQREFNVDDNRIELAAPFALRVHDATRNRSIAKMSRALRGWYKRGNYSCSGSAEAAGQKSAPFCF